MFKRFICLLLLGAVLFISSCGTQPVETDTGSAEPTATDSAAESVTETPETGYTPPKRDYDGRTFTFITGNEVIELIHRDEQNAEIVNDAMFTTELLAEDLYNIEIEAFALSDSMETLVASIVSNVMAGDVSFNAAYGNCVYLVMAQTRGVYKNLRSVEAFDFSQPWWPAFSVEAMTVNGQMYLGDSAVSCSAFTYSHVIFVNKTLMEDNHLEIPYDSVESGKWTLDQLISLTKDVYVDTNGDGQADPDDQYGMAGSYWTNHWALSSGYTVITKTGDDMVLKIDIDAEKMSTLVEKIYNWFYEEKSSYVEADPVPVFMNGHALFSEGKVDDAVKRLRDSSVKYGFLPYPKYTEAQDSYYTYTMGYVFILPNLDSDEDFDGNVLEALAFYRYRDLLPAYYETTVKGKLAEQAEDAKMLDIVYKTMTEPFDRCYDYYLGMQIVLNLLIPEHRKDFAAWYAANLPAAQKKLEALADFYWEHK